MSYGRARVGARVAGVLLVVALFWTLSSMQKTLLGLKRQHDAAGSRGSFASHYPGSDPAAAARGLLGDSGFIAGQLDLDGDGADEWVAAQRDLTANTAPSLVVRVLILHREGDQLAIPFDSARDLEPADLARIQSWQLRVTRPLELVPMRGTGDAMQRLTQVIWDRSTQRLLPRAIEPAGASDATPITDSPPQIEPSKQLETEGP